MDSDWVQTLLDHGESREVEFKREFNDDEVVEAVACLANGGGGTLLIGVADDGTVVGVPPRHGSNTDAVRVDALIAGKTSPPAVTTSSVVDLAGRQIVVVRVPRPDSVVATTSGRYLRRAVDVKGRPHCLPMQPADVLARASEIGGVDVSARAVPAASDDDLDPLEFERFRRLAASADGTLATLADADLVAALGLRDADGRLRLAALLLFGRVASLRRLVPSHDIAFQVLEGGSVRVNHQEPLPLIRALEELHREISVFNPEEEVQIGLFRLGLPRFARDSLRELLANAFVHRDYAVRGALVVQIEDGTLSITNPGGFPEGVTTENVHVSGPRPRNPLLADVFKRAGLVERTGRGVGRVFREQLAIGRSLPDYGRSTAVTVTVRLPAGLADGELAVLATEYQREGQPLGLTELMVIHEVRRERRVTSVRTAQLLQVGPDEARSVLNELVERGLLESRGERKGRTYHLSARLYQRLGEPEAYVRTRGFDAIQQEQMVLTFVRQHGSISRSQAASLCQLAAPAASALLRRLRDRGDLTMVGERRGARYLIADGSK